MTGDNDRETSEQFQDALNGDRESALAMWRLVVENPHHWETIAWVQAVAERILDADRETDRRRRPDAILKMVGLGGRKDPYRKLRELIEAPRGFEDVDQKEPSARGEASRALINYLRQSPVFIDAMRARGLSDLEIHDLGDHEIRKFVDRILES